VEDWSWWINTWQFVLDAADMTESDRALMAFSFGPFIGFWTAFDAATARGAMVIPTGGMSTRARLELLRSCGATVVFCTPSYALHMAQAATAHQVSLTESDVSHIIVAGEPGGSIPTVCERIESAWGARVVDHSGASEVGPWGYAATDRQGLHVVESEFIAEFISVDSGEPAADGELSELVLTTLATTRIGSSSWKVACWGESTT
jgi:phenylacetate-CoA ligase